MGSKNSATSRGSWRLRRTGGSAGDEPGRIRRGPRAGAGVVDGATWRWSVDDDKAAVCGARVVLPSPLGQRLMVLELGGSIDFRGQNLAPPKPGKKAKPWGRDTHDHCATAWVRGYAGSTDLVMGRELRTDERSWEPRVIDGRVQRGPRREPGTETPEEAIERGLPMAPSRSGPAPVAQDTEQACADGGLGA